MTKKKIDPALIELKKRFTPLKPIEKGDVNWENLEEATSLQFPSSFKEFISVYGSSIWFDTYYLFYTQAKTKKEIDRYKRNLQAKLDDIRFSMYDAETGEELEYGIGPSNPGILPFMNDFNGHTHLWLMSDVDPESWPVLLWKMGNTYSLGPLSVAEMFLRWLKREEPMFSVWGDSVESDFAKRPLSR